MKKMLFGLFFLLTSLLVILVGSLTFLVVFSPQKSPSSAPQSSIFHRVNSYGSPKGTIIFKPIGYIHSPYSPKTGAPRQGVLMPQSRGQLWLKPPYRRGLRDLDKFEYIIILYHFNNIKTWAPFVHPPKTNHYFGLWATRSPKRPNPIGFSIVKLEKVDFQKGILYLRGIDAFDGSPVLDIKPYLPSIDIVKSPRNARVEKALGHHNQIFIKDKSFFN